MYNSYLNFLGHPKWNEGSHEQRIKNQALRSSALSSPAVEDFEKHEGTHILQSLDGFAIALNSDGRFLYISETVSIYLGLSQVRYLFEIQIFFSRAEWWLVQCTKMGKKLEWKM